MSRETEKLSKEIGEWREKHKAAGFGGVRTPTKEDKLKAVELDFIE